MRRLTRRRLGGPLALVVELGRDADRVQRGPRRRRGRAASATARRQRQLGGRGLEVEEEGQRAERGRAAPCAARRGSRRRRSRRGRSGRPAGSPRCRCRRRPRSSSSARLAAVTLEAADPGARARPARRSGRAPRRASARRRSRRRSGRSAPSSASPGSSAGGEHHGVAQRAREPGLVPLRERVAAHVDVDDEVAAEQPGRRAGFPSAAPTGPSVMSISTVGAPRWAAACGLGERHALGGRRLGAREHRVARRAARRRGSGRPAAGPG